MTTAQPPGPDRSPAGRSPGRLRGVRAGAAWLMAPALALGLFGCAAQPDPREAAEALAADLADGTFDTAPLGTADEDAAAQADAALASVLGNLAAYPRTVEVGEIARDGGAATAALTWTWDLGVGIEPWDVPTTADLTLVDGAWVAEWSPSLVHPDAVETSVLRVSRIAAPRGDLLGTDGTPVVTERSVYRIGVDKANVPEGTDPGAVAQDLAVRLGFDDPAAYAERVASAGPAAYVVAITIRQEEAGQWDVAGLRQVPGVLVQSAELPLAPSSTFARPILGSVGEATAEAVEASDGAVRPGDQVGLAGLQARYDETLRGTPGIAVVLTSDEDGEANGEADGEAAEETVHEAAPVAGADLVITLDIGLQTLAEEILAEVGPASAIVAVQPSTGNVLAAASGPGGGGLNTATLGLFPPGSTFKVATALALVRAGLTPDSPLDCPPTATVQGRAFENYPGYPANSLGQIPLREVIAQSCNTALIGQHETVSAADVAEAAEALGIGADGAWPFPYEAGSVPADATGTSHAAGLIGQGDVLASPLAMAVAAASVAHGATVTPVLVADEPAEVEPPAAPLTADEAASLQTMMREVVLSGTGTFLQDVPGEAVIAKSGTAQYGTSVPPSTNAWMIAAQDDLAVAVFVQEGASGSATAGALLEEFLRGAA